jgi:hypothetical protein
MNERNRQAWFQSQTWALRGIKRGAKKENVPYVKKRKIFEQ